MAFTLTNTGVDLLRRGGNPPSADFFIRRDGKRYVFYHYAKKNAVAVYTGDGTDDITSIDAFKALKMYLITRRLTA